MRFLILKTKIWCYIKGHLISKCLLSVIVSTKIATKILQGFLPWIFLHIPSLGLLQAFQASFHCKYLNARSACNHTVISVYSHYPFDPNAKSSDTKCVTLSIWLFCIQIERVMTVYRNYNVIAFKSCIQIFTVYS